MLFSFLALLSTWMSFFTAQEAVDLATEKEQDVL